MKYLVDTNIFLEILLAQEKKEKCKLFLLDHLDGIHISDFSLHSLGVILSYRKKVNVFKEFAEDILNDLTIVTLPPGKYIHLPGVMKKYGLDFDDGYQACVAKEFSLRIMTMDKDFLKVKEYVKSDFI